MEIASTFGSLKAFKFLDKNDVDEPRAFLQVWFVFDMDFGNSDAKYHTKTLLFCAKFSLFFAY